MSAPNLTDRDRQDAVDRRMADDEDAFWTSCAGCFETGDYMSGAHNYPIHHLHGCHIGDGCTECNGRGIVLCYIGAYAPDEEEAP